VASQNQNLELETAQTELLSRISVLLSSRPWSPGIKRGIPVQVNLPYTLVLKTTQE